MKRRGSQGSTVAGALTITPLIVWFFPPPRWRAVPARLLCDCRVALPRMPCLTLALLLATLFSCMPPTASSPEQMLMCMTMAVLGLAKHFRQRPQEARWGPGDQFPMLLRWLVARLLVQEARWGPETNFPFRRCAACGGGSYWFPSRRCAACFRGCCLAHAARHSCMVVVVLDGCGREGSRA